MKIAKVYTEQTTLQLDKPFSYFVDENINIVKGVRVSIPFNSYSLIGYVEDIEEINISREEYEKKMGYKLKEIKEVIDEQPLLNDELISLAHYLAEYNIASLISCYQVMLPSSLKPTSSNKVEEKYFKCIRVIDNNTDGLSEKISALLKSLENKETYLRDIDDKYSINKLKEKGKIEIFEKEVYRDVNNAIYNHLHAPDLTIDQKKVMNEINNSNDQVYLLEGVTGSGKTEIYLRQAEDILKEGRNVLVLVPEISLTPLMIQRIKERLDYSIAVLHSGLSDGEKYDEYRRIKRGEVRVVVGARSAIFAPLSNIGLIVIDEEHSESYKEENAPCYKMIDVAIKRASYYNCKIIMGSATPSLESKTRAIKGIYHQLNLPKRINELELPDVSIINMLDEVKYGNYSLLSKSLKKSIQECIDNNQQVILLLNRRGYSSSIQCISCGYTFKCSNCGSIMHYHSSDNTLKCHYCGKKINKPDYCPKCGNKYLRHLGAGSQKLEEIIKKEINNSKVLRMDLDAVSKKGSLEKNLEDFKNKKYNIMLGTQIISKGLDFDNVSLVGVINADSLLYNGDFRSSEKTFQLLTQVVGRCGRGNIRGKAIIQTSSSSNQVILMSAKQDYSSFYQTEMSYRKSMLLPPYRNLVLITLGHKDKDKLYEYCYYLKEFIELNKNDEDIEVLGPTEPSLSFVNNQHRYRLLIKYKDNNIYELLNKIKNEIIGKGYFVKFDTSPMEN